MNGFPTDDGLEPPQVDIVSFYIDQFPESDIAVAVAAENGIPIYNSIVEALCLGDPAGGLAVDGVIVIGEHGTYATNELGQHMYPRRFFFEQVQSLRSVGGTAVNLCCTRSKPSRSLAAETPADKVEERCRRVRQQCHRSVAST